MGGFFIYASTEGVQLANTFAEPGVFVSGIYDADDAHMTSLTLLFNHDVIKRNMTYSCKIVYEDGAREPQVETYQLDLFPAGDKYKTLFVCCLCYLSPHYILHRLI